MKLCHENNGATIYIGRATTVHNPLLIYTTVEYLNGNDSIGQLLQDIFKIYCGLSTVKAKNAYKN